MTALAPADALAILQLVAQADSSATRRDAAGYAALFTEDGVMTGDMGHVRGRDGLAAAVARVWAQEPLGTLHLTCNAVLAGPASNPSVASILVMLIPQTPGAAVQAASITQRFARTPAGWRISSREITTGPATEHPVGQ